MGSASREEGREFLGVLDEDERVRPQVDRECAQPPRCLLRVLIPPEVDRPTTPGRHRRRHNRVELAPQVAFQKPLEIVHLY